MDVELSLHDYWRILRKRGIAILATFLATFLSTFFYTQMKTPVYRSRAIVKYEPPPGRFSGGDLAAFDPIAVLEAQARILVSYDMAERIGRKIGWEPAKLQGVIQAERVENANLIRISAVGADPVALTDIVNTALDVYVERDLEERSFNARKTLENVVKRRAEVENSLRDLEEKRKTFLQKHHSAHLGSSLSSSLLDLEARRRELLKKFTAEHPEVIKLEQRIETVKTQLRQVPTQETDLDRIVRDIKVNEEMYITLSRGQEEAKIALASVTPYVSIISRGVIPQAPISPNKKLNYMMGVILGLFLGFLLVFTLENLDISITTIEEIEKLLGVPVLGIVPHFGTEKKWAALRTEFLRKQRYPMDIFRSHLLFHYRAKSPVIEVYHTLRANIFSQLPKKQNVVLTFTSTGVAEGKTLTAINFCLAAAHAGLRTLLIGADIRRPVIYRIFGLPRETGIVEALSNEVPYMDVVKGTVDFLMGELDLDKLLTFSGIDNFKIMTGWIHRTTDVVNLFSSDAVPRLIDRMRPDYDLIVFDSPPILLFVDALLIGVHTDGVVMIYKSGKMARRALKRAKDQVAAAKANILGVVLNDMQASDIEPRYGYYYDYGHYAKKES
ncbi:MAG: hypothetical protein HY551_02345 [Elusimicrobia bacterium]|nr:hypothetical protein [Elusimicrobiota bacterium]